MSSSDQNTWNQQTDNINSENLNSDISNIGIHSDISNIGSDVNKLITKVFLHVIFNWHSISQNQEIMEGLDMESNTMCRRLKNQNPSLHDSYVQVHVLSTQLMMLLVITSPIHDVFIQ